MCTCVLVYGQRGLHTFILIMENLFKSVFIAKELQIQESLFLESLLDNRSALPEDLPISLSISLIRDVYTYSSLHTPTPWCNAAIEHPEPRTCYLPCLLVNHRQDQLVAVSDGGDGGGGDDWRMLVHAVVVVGWSLRRRWRW